MRIEGYQALCDGAAWLDLPGRGRIFVRGEDRRRLLHALTTNHIEQLEPGGGCYAFFLNAQGHILSDVNLLCMPDYFLLDTEPETAQKVCTHIDRYIIADDVAFEDATSGLFTLGIEGPRAADVLAKAGAPIPEPAYSHAWWDTRTVMNASSTGATGFLIFVPREEKDAVARQLGSGGAVWADAGAAEVVRLEYGKPRYGQDFTEANLPQETQLLHAVHFNKGCYLGQEIVERVRSRGHINRLLVRLGIDSRVPPPSGSKVLADGNEVGRITSAAFSPRLDKVVALAYVRTEESHPGKPLGVEGNRAEVVSLPVTL
jgi:folate-binding protein YgfZ